jgi:aflatoxin B1 aldehyde reductase
MRSPWRGADNAERNDGVIVGASSLEHLRHNLTAVTEGPLPVC